MQYSEFRARSVFHGKRKLFKNPEQRNFFHAEYSVHIHLGVIRVIWASVLCNKPISLGQQGGEKFSDAGPNF